VGIKRFGLKPRGAECNAYIQPFAVSIYEDEPVALSDYEDEPVALSDRISATDTTTGDAAFRPMALS
jgi:hypothetical protein